MALYLSVVLASFGNSFTSCVLHCVGIVLYSSSRLGSPLGFSFLYLTHWFIVATLMIVLVLTCTTGISLFLYKSVCFQEKYAMNIEVVTALAITGLVSTQLLLTVASLGLGASYGGESLDVGEGRSWRGAALQSLTQHSVSFFFAAALASNRFECSNSFISVRLIRSCWFVPPVLLALCWGTTLLLDGSSIPYAAVSDPVVLTLTWVVTLVPWVATGLFIS